MSATLPLHEQPILSTTLLAIALIWLSQSYFRRQQHAMLGSIGRQQLFDNSSDGLIVLDRRGRIVEHNCAAANLARLPASASGSLFARASYDELLSSALASLVTHTSSLAERTIAVRTKQLDLLQITIKPLADHARRRLGTLLVLRDISAQPHTPTIEADLAAIQQATARMHAAQDLETLLPAIVTAATSTVSQSHALISLLNPSYSQLRVAAESAGAPADSVLGRELPVPEWLPVSAIGEAQPIIIDDAQHDQRCGFMHELLMRKNMRALLIIPLYSSERLLGVLYLASADAQSFGQQRQALAQICAGSAAAALANIQLRNAAQQANRAKTAILDTVSHEFRTPITAILGFTELHQEGVLGAITAEQREALDATYRNSHRLLKLVDDLLDLARLEAGKLDLTLHPVEVPLCIQEACGALATEIAQKRLDLRVEIANGLPLATADAMWLRRVLTNLLANAVRFTSAGQIVVRAYELESHSLTAARRVVIEIEDSGQGIAEADQMQIFEAFQQVAASPPHTALPAGAGLGLAISKHAIEQMNGQLTLYSQLGHGSVFSMLLHTAELAREMQS